MGRKACVAGVAKEQAALIETMSLIPLEARSDPVDDDLEHEQDVSPGVFLTCAAHCTPGARILRTSRLACVFSPSDDATIDEVKLLHRGV